MSWRWTRRAIFYAAWPACGCVCGCRRIACRPRSPAVWSRRRANSRVLALESYAQIEGVLAQLRVEGIEVQELEVLQADLEDVFVQMMRRH